MNAFWTAIVIQAALNALFLFAGTILGRHLEGKHRDQIEQAMKLTDMLLDQRARHAEGANVIEFHRRGM